MNNKECIFCPQNAEIEYHRSVDGETEQTLNLCEMCFEVEHDLDIGSGWDIREHRPIE